MTFLTNLFGTKSATFSGAAAATFSDVKINGADYEAIDTKDGYFTIRDILMFSEVPKGEKNAPEDIKAAHMQTMVKAAVDKYEKEKFAAPAHKGHHKSLAFEDPEFLGFHLPKRVGKAMLDGKEQDAIYGDVKVKASAFERIRKGELPYVSPEVDWEKMQFSSLAFLDSMPPHFKGPLITIGKVTEDANAKFTVETSISKGLFMAFGDKEEKPSKKPEAKEGDGAEASTEERLASIEASLATIDKCMADIHYKMGMPYKGAQMSASPFHKADSSAPKEDNEKGNIVAEKKEDKAAVKFEDDPTALAKFAAQEARLKAMEDKLSAKETEEAKKARVTAAFEELKDYPLTDAGRDGIAKFADDPEKLKTFVEVLKAQTPKKSPRTVAEFEKSAPVAVPVSGADPDLAEFQLKRPQDMPAILRYAEYHGLWKASKASFGASDELLSNRKKFIEIMMKIDPTADQIKNHKIEGGK